MLEHYFLVFLLRRAIFQHMEMPFLPRSCQTQRGSGETHTWVSPDLNPPKNQDNPPENRHDPPQIRF